MISIQNYNKIFISILSVIIVTTVVLSSVLYVNFERIATRQLYDGTMEQLSLIRQNATIMKNSSHALAKQLYSDQFISGLLHYQNPDITDLSIALNQLNYYRFTMPYITSIYVYNRAASTFYTAANFDVHNSVIHEDQFPDQPILELLNSPLDITRPVPRSLSFDGPYLNKTENYYTFFYYDTLFAADNVVVLNISELWLNQIISGTLSRSETNIFIIDENGKLISDTWTEKMTADLSANAYIQKILESDSGSYLTDKVGGVNSLVAYTGKDVNGWRYVKITPYSVVMKDINRMKRNTLLIVAVMMAAVFFIAFIMSKRLHKPFEKMSSKLMQLETERRNHLAILKNDTLSSLISERETPHPQELALKFASYSISLDLSGTFVVALFRIDHYMDFLNQNSPDTRRLYKFGVSNICEELFRKRHVCEAFDAADDRIAVLIQLQDEHSDHEVESLAVLSREAIHCAQKFLKLSLSCSLSSQGLAIASIPTLFRQALDNSYYRLLRGYNSIITVEVTSRISECTFEYPQEKENRLVDALMMTRIEDALGIYDDIVREASAYSPAAVHVTISRLSYAVDSALKTLFKNNFGPASEVPKLTIDWNDIEIIDQINARFYDVFEQIALRISDKKSGKHQEMINKTLVLIESFYTTPDLSVDKLADELGLSPKYLSRLFKQITGKTIMDSVNELRLSKAQNLLLNTQEQILDIAIASGYSSSSYFHKIFKKEFGITPTEYRKSIKDGP